MVNVAQVALPTRSVTTNVYVHSPVIVVQLVYSFPFNVAQERLVSLKVIA